MTKKRMQEARYFYETMERYGFTEEEADQVRRIGMTLRRWYEMECNGEIERNEETGKPEAISQAYLNGRTNERRAYPINDREKGAEKRLAKIMENKPRLWYYLQTDPRGCSVFVGRKDELQPGDKLDNVYSGRGFGVAY